ALKTRAPDVFLLGSFLNRFDRERTPCFSNMIGLHFAPLHMSARTRNARSIDDGKVRAPMKENLIRHFVCSCSIATLVLTAFDSQACGTDAPIITNLPPMDSGGYQVYGLNPSGELTGFFYNSMHPSHAFTYQAGAITDLGTLGGTISIGYAINSS